MRNDQFGVSLLHAKYESAKLSVNTSARSQLKSHWVAAQTDLESPILVGTYHYRHTNPRLAHTNQPQL